MPDHSKHRIAFLDGLRGVAILMVLMVHSYAGYPELYSYGRKFFNWPLFFYGWLGVQLFFLISGFVILMTLEKCRSFPEFILRRWLRLFPAMAICSAIVFATARFFPERPLGAPVWRDLLPGLTFTEPSWWEIPFGPHQGILEGAFWSLVVEMKFYIVFGLAYFCAGWKKAVGALISLFAISAAQAYLKTVPPGMLLHFIHYPAHLAAIVSAQYFGWFAAGALYYRYFATKKRVLLVSAIGVVLASAAYVPGGIGSNIAALGVGLIFTLSVVLDGPKRILGHPVFLFGGFISYPLYLLHENMLVAAIVKIGRAAPWVPALAIPVLPISGIIVLAWLVARWLEPWIRDIIRPIYQRIGAWLGVLRPEP